MKSRLQIVILAGALLLGQTCLLQAYEGFHGKGHAYTKANFDSLFAAATPLDESAEGQDLLKACLEAYGGEEHLRALKSLRLRFSKISALSGDTVEVTREFDADRRYRSITTGGANPTEFGLNGATAWATVKDSVAMLVDHGYANQLFNYLTINLPLSMAGERFDETRFARQENDTIAYLYLLKKDSLMFVVGIDPDDLMVKSSTGVIYREAGYVVFADYFSNHTEHSGYLLPGVIHSISMGLTMGDLHLEKVEVNPDLADGTFIAGDPARKPD